LRQGRDNCGIRDKKQLMAKEGHAKREMRLQSTPLESS